MIANFGIILLCLALGILFRRKRVIPDSANTAFNYFVLNVSVPALALQSMHEVQLSLELAYPIGMAWLLFAGSWAFFEILGRVLGWSRQTIGALVLTAGLGNTSFIGYPLITAFYGAEGLKTAVLTDQGGSFLVLSSLGILVASLYSARSTSFLKTLPRKLLTFPPFVAMLIAIALRPWPYPPALEEILRKLSAPLVPLALVSVGLHLGKGFGGLSRHSKKLALGLTYKLLLGPAMIYLLYVVILGAHGTPIQISITQAAMAPMITAGILASDHGLEPELSNLMLTIGIPISLLIVPLWSWFLSGI